MKASMISRLACGLLVLLFTSIAHAITFTGTDQNGNPVGAEIPVAPYLDFSQPYLPGLGGCGGASEPIIVHYTAPPVTIHGETYDKDSADQGPTWKYFPPGDCLAANGDLFEYIAEGDLIALTYVWGVSPALVWDADLMDYVWKVPEGCGATDSNLGATSYTGTYSGTNNARWDCAKLTVYYHDFGWGWTLVSALLDAREQIATSPSLVVRHFTYTLYP